MEFYLFCKGMMIWGQQRGKTGHNFFKKKITKQKVMSR